MLQILKREIAHCKKLAASYIAVMLAIWLAGIATPYISGVYIDYLVAGLNARVLLLFISLLAAINLLQMLLRYTQSVVSTKLNNRIAYQIGSDIFQKIFTSEYKYYGNIDSAYYIDQINKDSHTLVQFFSSNVINFFLQAATIVMSAVIVFRADKLLCIIIFSLVPFYILTFLLNKTKMYQARRESKEKANEYFSRYTEQMDKLPYIKRNVLNAEMETRLHTSFETMLGAALRSVRVDYLFTNLNQVVVIVAYLCIVGIGGYKVSTGALSIGYFSIINTYFNMILRSVSYFIGLAGSYQDTKVSFQRIRKILDTPDEAAGAETVEELKAIEVKDLSIRYGDTTVLERCSCRFEQGKLYGICGQNGGGKTTLLNAVAGIFAGEHTGTVLYDGRDIAQLDMPRLRRQKIAYVEQDPVLFNMPVKEYLGFGVDDSAAVRENRARLLAVWDIGYLLDKEMNENGSNFSGGEKQKLAMVRALSKDSVLILLDEPTSALDKDSIARLLALLQERKRHAIVLLISHDREVLAQCDEVLDITGICQTPACTS